MNIARFHTLPVWQIGAAGALLGDRHDWVILPSAELPDGLAPGDRLRVFVTTDTHDAPMATLRAPLGQAGDLIVTTVVDVTPHGVFVDWGLPKDLFVPWRNQHTRAAVGDRVVVHVGVDDDTQRPVGATKLVDRLDHDTSRVRVNQAVELLVFGHNDLGVLVAVDRRWGGLLYHGPDVGHLTIGDVVPGFVERVRDDGKLDVTLRPVGREGSVLATDQLAEALREAGGFLPLTDHSDPDLIRRRVGLSKKAFKKAVGALYKQRKLRIEEGGVRWVGRS